MTLRRVLLLIALSMLVAPGAGSAAVQQTAADIQREIRESQLRLEEIRAERARLQAEMRTLRDRVQNVSGQLQNIERQISASRSVLAEIEFQVEASTDRARAVTVELLRTRENLRERQAVLDRRLRTIYMRGPLLTARVLLGADSFADLLNRYRYLRLMASYDRSLLDGIRDLENALQEQNIDLDETLVELRRLREQQLGEVAELRQVENEHQRTLDSFLSQERQVESRMEQLQADENRLSGLVDDLEARRIEAERRRAAEGRAGDIPATTLGTIDRGVLDWPVEGDVIYRFGPERRPNGTVLRWNGVGIGAPAGTPVRAVRGGTVALAGPFEGYGPTVILSHGDGFYTLYLYLEETGVVEGRRVQAGQVVGTVGGEGTPEGPHLEFQLRVPGAEGAPEAVDPLEWLRSGGGE